MNRNKGWYWVGLIMDGLVSEPDWFEILRRRLCLIESKMNY